MIFKQVFDKESSTYTYLIASAEGREALIIDPVLENVEDYIKLLNQLNLKSRPSELKPEIYYKITKLYEKIK